MKISEKTLRYFRIVFLLNFTILLFIFCHSNANTPEPNLTPSHHWENIPIRTADEKKSNFKGGEGFQKIYGLAFSNSSPSIAYLSTDTSQIWKSIDGGTSWIPKNNGFYSHGARSLAIDPVNPDIVFAAGFAGYDKKMEAKYPHLFQGIYRTLDGGEKWTFLRKTSFFKQKSKGQLFCFLPSSSDLTKTKEIYCGSSNEGLLYSSDSGENWRSVGFKEDHIIQLLENPTQPGQIFVSTETGLFTFSNDETNKIGNGLPSWPLSITLSPSSPNIIYAAVGKHGVYKSKDFGVNFSKLNINRFNFSDIAVSPINSDIVYAMAHKSTFNPFYSHNGGEKWSVSTYPSLKSWDKKPGFWVSGAFAPHPHNPLIALVAANGKDRIFKTFNGGKKWYYSGNGLTGGRMRDIIFVDNDKMIFCLTDFGLWITENHGDTFQKFKVKRIQGSQSSYSGDMRNKTIVASLGKWRDKGLIVSHDSGKSWKYFKTLTNRFKLIRFHPQKESTVYAGPYKSIDNGKSWLKLSHTIHAMYEKNGDILYSYEALDKKSSNILKSPDRGKNWEKPYPPCPISANNINQLAVAPDNSNRLYIATDNGVYIYDGKKWMNRNNTHGLDLDFFYLCNVGSLAIDPRYPNIIYAARLAPARGQSNGIFRSDDYGKTWQNITSNIGPGLSVWAVKVSPFDSTVYIGTSRGTYRLPAHDRPN